MKTRQQVEAEIRTDNPTSDNLTAGHPVYEALIAKWTDARMADLATAAPPVIVSFRALAFVLNEAGLYQQVKTAAMSSIEGEIWWNTAQSTTVQRDHPFVAALGQAIGQTPDQLDAIFAAAASA